MGRVAEIVLVITTALSFVVTVLVNYFIGFGRDINGVNFTAVGDVSDIYGTNITPSGWAFSIWGVIYVWQAIWIIYFVTLLFRKTDAGKRLSPPVGCVFLFYFFYIVNLFCNIAWIFTWSLQYVEYALLCIGLIAVFLWCALATSLYGLNHKAQQLADSGNKKDVWFNIIFVHNGIAIYGTWVTVATMINLNVVLVTFAGMGMVDGSTIALFCLATIVAAWFVIETFVFERACRYCLVPYAVVAYAVGGSADRNWNGDSANSIISVALIGISLLLLLIKMGRAIYNERRSPLYGSTSIKSTLDDTEKIKV